MVRDLKRLVQALPPVARRRRVARSPRGAGGCTCERGPSRGVRAARRGSLSRWRASWRASRRPASMRARPGRQRDGGRLPGGWSSRSTSRPCTIAIGVCGRSRLSEAPSRHSACQRPESDTGSGEPGSARSSTDTSRRPKLSRSSRVPSLARRLPSLLTACSQRGSSTSCRCRGRGRRVQIVLGLAHSARAIRTFVAGRGSLLRPDSIALHVLRGIPASRPACAWLRPRSVRIRSMTSAGRSMPRSA